MNHILLAAAADDDDAAGLRDRILALVASEAATVWTDLTTFPDPSEATVAVVVLSSAAFADPAIVAFVRELGRRRVELVPVVEDVAAFDFSAVTLPEIEPLNAVGWQPDDGAGILDAVRGYLGLEAFPRRKKVFISYRRQDGEAIAQRLYKYLRRNEYEPFLDVFRIEAGAPVQERIMEEIADKDFVLLVDTPEARRSEWIRAEIVEALNQRIPVRCLAVGQSDPYPLLPDAERLTWPGGGRIMARVREFIFHGIIMARVREFISRGIGAASSFDVRCRRVLHGVAEARGLRLVEDGRRRVRFRGGLKGVLVEYEHALPSLERLHRLYKSYRVRGRGTAVLVSGDQPIPDLTAEAISWARGRAPLHVVYLHDLYSVLDQVL
jgi:hypothetical protein